MAACGRARARRPWTLRSRTGGSSRRAPSKRKRSPTASRLLEPSAGMDRTNQPVSDQEFLGELREAVDRYFRAVDAWEAAYYKYYRLPDPTRKITPDLAEQEREFTASRKRLEELAPRARRLGFA